MKITPVAGRASFSSLVTLAKAMPRAFTPNEIPAAIVVLSQVRIHVPLAPRYVAEQAAPPLFLPSTQPSARCAVGGHGCCSPCLVASSTIPGDVCSRQTIVCQRPFGCDRGILGQALQIFLATSESSCAIAGDLGDVLGSTVGEIPSFESGIASLILFRKLS